MNVDLAGKAQHLGANGFDGSGNCEELRGCLLYQQFCGLGVLFARGTTSLDPVWIFAALSSLKL